MTSNKKIVFIEEINSSFYQITKQYLQRDFAVYYSKIDKKFKQKNEIKKYLKIKKLISLQSLIFDYASVSRKAAFFAHENIDDIFEEYFSRSSTIKQMQELLQFPNIEIIYKKKILQELEKIYEIELRINEIAGRVDNSDEIYFYPKNNYIIHIDTSSPIKSNIKIINYKKISISYKKLLYKIRKIIYLTVPIYFFLKKVKKISNDKIYKEFKVGITIDHPKRIFSMNYLTDAIFIDNIELPKEHILFLDQSKGINSKDYDTKGCNYINVYDDKENISRELFWNKIVKSFVPKWCKTFILSFLEDPLIIDINKAILLDYIIWNIFTDNYKLKNYLKRLLPDLPSKIHILSQSNIKTWFIYPDNSSVDYLLDWDENKKNQTLFSFIYYDYCVINGEIVKRYLKKHRNYFKKYIKTGNLYSQIVRELQTGKLPSPIFTLVKKKKLPKKLICAFDTTYVDWGPIKIKDGIKFGNDILQLLADFPDIGIMFKAKKEFELTPYLKTTYEKLKNHERCLFVARYDKEGISAPEVIAVSDFVISAAYTSTSAEALGARIKAIYYDIPGHEIGDKYYFNRYPNFVAHNYEELKRLINYWLYEVTDKEFEKFLNKYVKDEMDPYLDGKALTRFRKLLME